MAQYTVLANTTIVETTEDLEEAIRIAKAIWEKNADETFQSGGDATVDCYVVIMDDQGHEVWYDQKDYTEEDGKTHYDPPKRRSWWDDWHEEKTSKNGGKLDKSKAVDIEPDEEDDYWGLKDFELEDDDMEDFEFEDGLKGPYIWAVAPLEAYSDTEYNEDGYYIESEYEYDELTDCFEDGLEEAVEYAKGETEEACRLDLISMETGDVVESVIVQSDGEYY